MFKTMGVPIFAVLAFMALLAPAHANAGVRFGITVGPPVYYAPPYAYSYPYPYAYDPYAYGYPYRSYYYSAPYRPYYRSGFYWRGHERREFFERRGFRERERGFRDGRRFRR